MQLPNWMKIGDKSVVETLIIWGIPLLVLLGLSLAIWGSVTDNSPQNNFNPNEFNFGDLNIPN